MEYNSKSLTRAGAVLFANADANKQPLIVDKVVVSDKVIPAGTDISTLTLDDFTNAQQFDANNVTQNDNTFTVTSVLSNENLKTDLSLALIGILAHLGTDTSTQTIIGVAIGNDPFVLPAYNGTPFRLVPSITMGFSASQNVTLQVNDDVYITQKDMQTLMKSQGFLTKADVDAFGYATEKYVDAATTVKADDSKVVHTADTSNWQKQKITNDDGTALISIGDSDDLSSKLSSFSAGFFTFYYSANCANNPSTKAGRGFVEMTYADPINGSDGSGILFDEDNVVFVVTILNSKVTYFRLASLSGANNFDTVPTVNNNPLLLASSLPSDLARTGQDQEFTGKNTFDTAPIDKTTGKPFITEDELNAGIQKAIDQANTDMLAELTKRGYPSLVWKGTQAEFDALPTKDPNGEYQIVEDNS